MAWPIYLLFLSIIYSYCSLIASASDDLSGLGRVCYGNATKISTSTNINFQNNVQSLLSVLVSESSSHRTLNFFNTSLGRVSSRAYGSYTCRGDLSSKQCDNCLVNVTRFLSSLDIDYKECYGFDVSGKCIVRFANSSKFSLYEEDRVIMYQSIGNNVTNYKQYNVTLSNTMEGLIREASYGNWSKGNFATREIEVINSPSEKFYVLVQCTPDISPMNCSKCLRTLYFHIPDCCAGSPGGVLVHANCLIRYNNESFIGRACHGFMPGYLHVTLSLLFLTMFAIM